VFQWDDLRYFLALERVGTLAGTARQLGVEHTTVARRIAALEEALASKLFTRTPDRFRLTEAGARMLDLAQQVERCALGIERLAASGDRVEGIVRVAVSEAFSGFIVRRLPPLRERYPDLTVELLTSNVALDLTRHEADIAIRAAATSQPELITRKLLDAGWSLYAAEGYLGRKPLNDPPDDLKGHEVVGYEGGLTNVPGAVWLREHGKEATVVMRGTSIPAIVSAVVAGIGVSVIPCFLGATEATLRRMTPKVLGARELCIVVHPDMRKVPRVRVTYDYIVEMMRTDAALLRGDGHAAGGSSKRRGST
jgi:DNA-binding transcriptional LysR family regulator